MNRNVHVTEAEPPVCWLEAVDQSPRQTIRKTPQSVYCQITETNPSKNPRTDATHTPKRTQEEADKEETIGSTSNPIQLDGSPLK